MNVMERCDACAHQPLRYAPNDCECTCHHDDPPIADTPRVYCPGCCRKKYRYQGLLPGMTTLCGDCRRRSRARLGDRE